MQATLQLMQRAPIVQLRYSVREIPEAWVLAEDKVPESTTHDEAAERLKLVLKAWARGIGRPVRVARNLAIRFVEADPRIGIDSDVCLLDPAPRDGEDPVHSSVLGAWLIASQRHLVIADDREGTQPWLSEAERERAQRLMVEAELADLRKRHQD